MKIIWKKHHSNTGEQKKTIHYNSLGCSLVFRYSIYYSSLGESAGLTNTADKLALIDVDAALKAPMGYWKHCKDLIAGI